MPSFCACPKHGRHGVRLCCLCNPSWMNDEPVERLRRLARCIQAEVKQDQRDLAAIDRELRRRGLKGL